MARWELVPHGYGFELLRDGQRVVRLGGSPEFAETRLLFYVEQEGEAIQALAAGDPLALCQLGWHRGAMPAPVGAHIGVSGTYFRFAAKIGEAGGTLVYQIAEEPFEYVSRTVKTLGSLGPWLCSVCRKPIDTAELR